MTTYFVELGFCFQPRPTAFTLENNACGSFAQVVEPPQTLSPWTDGTWWIDFNGMSVGWLEADGTTFYPPLASYPGGPVTPPVTPPVLPVLGTAAIAVNIAIAASNDPSSGLLLVWSDEFA